MNIIDITKDYLELLMAKKDIESMLYEKEEITEDFSIGDFIKYLNFGTHIYYVNPQKLYPYKIVKTKTNEYLFILNHAGISFAPLHDMLESIKYDYSQLTRLNQYQVAERELMNTPHFIINEELYFDLRDKN